MLVRAELVALGSQKLLTGHTGDVSGVSFSPDGGLLASASADDTVRLSATPGAWVVTACAHAGRNLSRREWEQYVGKTPYVRHCRQFPAGPGADQDAPLAEYPTLPDAYLGDSR